MDQSINLTAHALVLRFAACGGSGGDQIQKEAEAPADGSIDLSIIPAQADAGDGDLTLEEIKDAVEEFEDEFTDLINDEYHTDLMALLMTGEATFDVAESEFNGLSIERIDPDEAD